MMRLRTLSLSKLASTEGKMFDYYWGAGSKIDERGIKRYHLFDLMFREPNRVCRGFTRGLLDAGQLGVTSCFEEI